jgi:hypothetical protein
VARGLPQTVKDNLENAHTVDTLTAVPAPHRFVKLRRPCRPTPESV